MLTKVEARNHRNDIDSRLNPGFRHSEPARLLADAYALALTVADETESRQLKRDCLDSALQIEEYLLDTLSGLRVSKDDVQGLFDEMREKRPGWPDAISPVAWGRLAATRLLRDIADVVCGGGDYWEAIRFALHDEFEEPLRPAGPWHPRTLYLAFHEDDWKDANSVADALPEPFSTELRAILERVRLRTDDHFAMVVWSVQDVLDATARAKDAELAALDEATWEQAAVSREWVNDIMDSVGSALMDRMAERGWDVLDDAINAALESE